MRHIDQLEPAPTLCTDIVNIQTGEAKKKTFMISWNIYLFSIYSLSCVVFHWKITLVRG